MNQLLWKHTLNIYRRQIITARNNDIFIGRENISVNRYGLKIPAFTYKAAVKITDGAGNFKSLQIVHSIYRGMGQQTGITDDKVLYAGKLKG